MFLSTQDIFWFVFALSMIVLTIFLSFALFYIISILRDVSKLFTSIRGKIELVDKILNLVKEKLEKSSNHLALIADNVMKIVGYFMDKPKKKR